MAVEHTTIIAGVFGLAALTGCGAATATATALSPPGVSAPAPIATGAAAVWGARVRTEVETLSGWVTTVAAEPPDAVSDSSGPGLSLLTATITLVNDLRGSVVPLADVPAAALLNTATTAIEGICVFNGDCLNGGDGATLNTAATELAQALAALPSA